MPKSFYQFLRGWCQRASRAARPVRGITRVFLGVNALEDRLAPAFLGGLNTALGDLDGDGVLDLVTAAGPGGGPHVTAFSGATGEVIRSFYAFDPRFTGGVNVAVADVNGDGTPDIIAGAGEGGGPHVKVFDGRANGVVYSEYVYLERFRGGVNVGTADLDGDGTAEILTGAGIGGGPHVQAIDATTGAIRRSFYAYAERFRGGATVTAGDITGDGVADLMTGAGPGGGPHVAVFDGATGGLWASYYAYTPSYSVGVRVASGDVDGNGLADVTVTPMKEGGPHLRTFAGRQSVILDLMVEDPNYRGSLSAAVGDLDGDGFDDVFVGNGVGLPGRVRSLNGYTAASGPAMTVFGDPPTVAPFAQAVSELPKPIFDGPAFRIPASPRNVSEVEVTPKHRLTPSQDEVGFYRVDDADGRIGALLPGDAGYAAAALADDRRLPFAPGGQFKATLPAGGWYAHYLIADATHAEWVASNPANAIDGSQLAYFSFAAANPDDTAHLRYVRERNRFAWENQAGGGDDDTNDFIGELTLIDGSGESNPGPPVVVDQPPVVVVEEPPSGVNTPPTISDIPDQVTTTGTTVGPLAFVIGDRETPLHQLTLTASSDNPTLLPNSAFVFDGSGANRTLTFTPTAGLTGGTTITVTVSDGELTARDTLTLTVNNRPVVIPPTVPFPDDLDGWTVGERGGTAAVRGTVTAVGGNATLAEGDSFVTTLSKSFVVPAVPTLIQFTYAGLNFDTTDAGFVNDAFEAALVDAAGNPLVPVYSSGRDAFFNVTDGNVVTTGVGTTIAGRTITVDLTDVPAGTVATLVFRLVNNDADTGSTVTLASTALPTAGNADAATKFYVVDDGTDRAFRYGDEGLGAGQFATTGIGNASGAASNPAGDRVWVVDDTTKAVTVFGPTGTTLGGWTATDTVDPQGITVDGGTLWLVDRGTNSVRRYVGGALLTTGTATATDTFALDAANASPSDLVTDGGTVWVTDDATAKVFVYDVSGTLLGSWQLDGDNAAPSGITRNPAGGTDLWVLDRATKRVFQYGNGANLRTGQHTADGTFHLAPSNTSPEGIADPPQSPAGYSLLDPTGRAVFDTAADFRDGTLFNLTAVEVSGDIRLNTSATTEIPPFIWVSNSSEGTVSRFDTRTGVEVGRYRTGPSGAIHNPSRTAVAGDGSVWVANRAFNIQGSVVHVLLDDFIDRNGNGVVDTSTDRNNNGRIDANEILPWDANGDGQPDDERIALSVNVGRNRANPDILQVNGIARAVAIDADDNVWVGLHNLHQYEVYSGTTGELLGVVPVRGIPYGAVIDGNGVLWTATRDGSVDRIDTVTRTALPSVAHGGDNYGISLGGDGAVWVSTYSQGRLHRIDPDTLAVTTYSAPGVGALRGVGVSNNGDVWVASNGPDALTRFRFEADGVTLLDTKTVRVGSTASAAVIDADGYVWTTTYGDNKAWKIDPETVEVVPGWPIATGLTPYNYSDMTGQVRLGVTQRTGTWTEILDGGRAGAAWAAVGLDALTPTDTSVVVRVRVSDDDTLLPSLAWRTITPDTVYRDLRGRYIQVEVSLRSREPDFNPLVNSVTVSAVLAPTLEVFHPADGTTLPAETTFVLDGLATAAQPEYGPSLVVGNRIVAVTVNGVPVDVLDDAGRFYARVTARPGENTYTVVAYDEFDQTTTVIRTLVGETRTPGSVDSSPFVDLTSGFKAEYGRTSYRQSVREMYADIAVRNISDYPAGVPLYVAVRNISDPAVRVLNAAGTLPDGTPYYDFTGLVTGGAGQLAPNAKTGTLSLSFANPNRGRFTYDLVFLGVPNRPPAFTTIPELEATVGREYRYPAAATDPDGDPLAFGLVSGPVGMAVEGTTGVVTWTPPAAQVGNFPVTLRVSDGRGGTAEQSFTVVSAVSRPNRPPVFTTLPVIEAQAGQPYTYDADATDPDRDTLTYSLEAGFPAGMTIDAATGAISWMPDFPQLGDAEVTIIADDGHGGLARQTFTICVKNDANRPPVIVSEPVRTARVESVVAPGMRAYPDVVLDYQANGTTGIPEPYGRIAGGPANVSVNPNIVLGEPPPSPRVGGNPTTDWLSIPAGSWVTVGFTSTTIIDGPGDDIFIRSLDPADSAGESADIYVSTDLQNFVRLGIAPQGGNVGLDLAPLGLTAPVRAVRVVGLDNRGSAPGFDLVSVEVFPQSIGPNETYTYTVVAVDPDGGPLTYSLTQAPDGMTINATTGVVSWAPSQDVANQSFPVTVRVDDGRGGSDEQKFTVTVKALGSTAREFDPVVEWQKDTFSVVPSSDQIEIPPLVIDLNGDGVTELVFTTYSGSNNSSNALLRAIDGRNGTELWTVLSSQYELQGRSPLAAGDIDGDGRPEIIGVHESDRLIAFEHDGTFKWLGPVVWGGIDAGSPAIADLDRDGVPEIVIGGSVVNADGTLRWNGNTDGGLGRGSNGYGGISIVADLDLDGSPEIVAGRTAYRSDGAVFWNASVGDGFAAIGNFDADPFPEVVLVSAGSVYLLEHDGTFKWGPVVIPGGGRGGAPTVADFDNDGQPEIGVAGATQYIVIETDGTIKLQRTTRDNSSNTTGSSVFDFDGDGSAEVVYGDELFLRILRGTDGEVLYELPKSSGTVYEYPVIADVDGDGNAEIVAVANRRNGFGPQNGLYVIGDRNNTWVNARPIWNQHTYHITNVNDDGTIPANEANSWQVYNTYRTNVLTDGVDPRAAVDLVVASLTRVGTDSPLTFTARVENIGNAPVNAGATLALYDGDPMKGGVRVGTATTTLRLRPTEGEDLTVTLTVTAVNDLWAVVDPENVIAEFDDDNNALRGVIDTDPVNYAPRLWREITDDQQTATANVAFRLALPVVDPDGDALTYSVISGPDGLTVHPTLGVVAWVPKRGETGTHRVVIRATDPAGNLALLPFNVTVLAPNTAPVITSTPAAGPATAGLPFEYRATAQDAETPQAELRYSLRDPLPGMAIDAVTGVFTWTPTAAQAGTRTVTVVVGDGTSGTEQTTSLLVSTSSLTVNRSPTVTAVSAAGSTWLGRPYSARVSAGDPDGDPIRFELVSGPAGMTVEAVTGVITWSPTATTAAPVPVEVRVTDGRGGVATASFNVTAESTEANLAPQVVSVPPRTAVHGSAYAYDLAALDPDGDPLVWQLVAAPQGVSLDPVGGTLRWTPADDQSGPNRITVRVTDPAGASSEQTFAVTVSCENQPPNVVSRPPTEGFVGFPYLYAVRATDSEGDPLTFRVESGPAGMTFTAGTSLLRWTPTAAQAGPQTVVVKVTDAAGNVARQTFTVIVSTESPNRPPVVTSRPPTSATLGRAFAYAVVAHDPDGDPLTYALTESFDGMAISDTGIVTWLPTTAGSHTVTVAVTDPRGAVAVQSFTLVARANRAPVLLPLPDAEAVIGGPFRALASATDLDGDPLTFALAAAPTGMSIDSQGRILWTPTGSPRTETVRVAVSDADGLSAEGVFQVRVTADTQAPAVTLLVVPDVVNVGAIVTVRLSATDNVGVTDQFVTVGGATLTLDPGGQAAYSAAAVGLFEVVGTARDLAGNSTTTTWRLRVIDPRDAGGPTVIITAPTNDGLVSGPVAVTGSVFDPDGQFDFYRVYYARADRVDPATTRWDPASGTLTDPDYVLIGGGTTEVRDGVLATFDPTTLADDAYVLVVAAFDVNGQGWLEPVRVSVAGGVKLGEFSLAFTDLSLQLAGLPVTVTRTYSTLDTGDVGSFGYGWQLGGVDARVRETVAGTGDGFFTTGGAFRVGTRVFLTAPDGQRVSFRFDVDPTPSLLGAVFLPKFVADPGVYYRLEVDPLAIRQRADGTFAAFLFGFPYNPDQYRLIAPDGTRYEYDQFAGLRKVTDPFGNTLTYTANGIFHSSGEAVLFTRDGQGRITAAVAPDGTRIRYAYSAAGDLISVTDQTGNVARLAYRTDRPHYLDSITDPLGNRAVRTEFDAAGRIVAVTDANGNRTASTYDPDALAEVVRDALGHETRFTYDARGNVTKRVNPLGDTTLFEYGDPLNPERTTRTTDPRGFVTLADHDSFGNVIRMTDADGKVWEYEFTARNKPAVARDPLGRVTVNLYDAQGNRTQAVAADGTSTLFAFDAKGRVTGKTDAEGRATTYAYGAFDLASKITHPDGSFQTAEYDRNGQPIRFVDENGFATGLGYDARGRLVTVTAADGGVRRFEYDGNDRLTQLTDPLGRVTRREYDAVGNLVRVVDPLGGTQAFVYDPNRNLIGYTDQVGATTKYAFDAANRWVSTTDALGGVTAYEYDGAGNRTAEIDALGRRRVYVFDALNRLIRKDDCPCPDETYEYDAVGNLVTLTDKNGHATRYTYDALNRLFTVTDALGGVTALARDKVGNVVAETNPLGAVTRSAFDARDRLVAVTDPLGAITRFGYDPAGNRITVTDPLGNITRYAFDELNRVVGVTDPTDGHTAFAFDLAGNRIGVTDANGNTTTSAYDKLDRLVSVTDPLSGITRYGYDKAGRQTSITDPVGNVTTHEFDKLGRQVAITDPLGKTATSAYDVVGNRVETVDRNGRRRTFEFDILDRPVAERWWAGPTEVRLIRTGYDSVGNVVSVSDPDATYRHAYDALDRLVSVDNTGTPGLPAVVLTSQYDAAGNRIAVADGAGTTVTSAYDKAQRLVSRSWAGGGVDAVRTDFTRDLRGDVTAAARFSTAAGDVLVGRMTAAFDPAGRVADLRHTDAAGSPLQQFTYAFDPAGRVTAEVRNGVLIDYGYDETDQLLSVDRDGSAAERYAFDANGNRTTAGYVTGPGNRVLTDARYDYAYDNEGNLVRRTDRASGEVTTYVFDHRNRLTSVSVGAGPTARTTGFRYDPLDRRIAKTANGSTLVTVYDGEHAWADYTSRGAVVSRYLFGDQTDELLAVSRPGTGVSWALADRLGTVHGVTTAAGSMASATEYDSFGRITAQTNPAAGVRFTFTGREFDHETGLYYYRARYYDPALGRFISEDPLRFDAGDSSLFRYVGNSPTNGTDPSGEVAALELGVLQGAIALSVAYTLTQFTTYEYFRGNISTQGAGNSLFGVTLEGIYQTLAAPLILASAVVDTIRIIGKYNVTDATKECDADESRQFNPGRDSDWRGLPGDRYQLFNRALDEAFRRTGVPRSSFTPTMWAVSDTGKTIPVEYRSPDGAEVSVDNPVVAPVNKGPLSPHVGFKQPGKRRDCTGPFAGHIYLDYVPASRHKLLSRG